MNGSLRARVVTLASVVLLAVGGWGARAANILDGLPARNIGPASMGGRIVDIEGVESNPQILYVAAATGGIWQTTDGATSWTGLFQNETTMCTGDIAVSLSNPDIVWVGSGEANPRNSVS